MYTRLMPFASAARALAVSFSMSLSLGMGTLLPLAAGLLVGGAPGRASARPGTVQGQQVAVAKLAFEGGMPEAARDLFAQRLVEGLAAAQFEVLAGPTVRQRLQAAAIDLSGCRAGACLARAAAALDVAFLVIGSVEEHDKNYEITLELVNGRSGVTIGTNRERCEICGVEEASEKVGLAASALRSRLEALARTPARFVIRSRPAGARVKVDGESAGRTPLDHELGSGVHRLELAADGYEGLVRTVTAVSGVDETLDLELVPLPTKFPYRLAGWAAVVGGVAAMAVGVWALSADGHQVSCAAAVQDVHMQCPTVRDLRVPGAAILGIGAASATLGATWIYFGRVGSPRAGEGTQSAGVTLGGRF
jgi:TolB-like protein